MSRGNVMGALCLAVLLGLPCAVGSEEASRPVTWVDPESQIGFAWIAGGCFQMGAASARSGGPMPDELPRHEVCVDGFWLGIYEVTNGDWDRVMGQADTDGARASYPKADVTYEEINAFVERMNAGSHGLGTYRLPTEAEWEYACSTGWPEMVGVTGRFELKALLQDKGWIVNRSLDDARTYPVGGKYPDAWGLHDMLGNVWEWTADEYVQDGYRHHERMNPLVDRGGERRVIRGGSYLSRESLARCGARNYGVPSDPLPTVGFRVARTAPAP